MNDHCMLCDRPAFSIYGAVMRCQIDPSHDQKGQLCMTHQRQVFITRTVDARCAQCFPDAASIDREIAEHPEGRSYLVFQKAGAA